MTMNVYEIITDKILGQLRKGIVPWSRPWRTDGLAPTNAVSKREYRGINIFLLAAAQAELGPDATPYWLSYNQAKALGGNVKKGSKATMVVFWKIFDGKSKDDDGEEGEEKGGRKSLMLRYYNVFNLSQCEGLDKLAEKWKERVAGKDKDAPKPIKPVKRAENIIKNFPAPKVSIKHEKQSRAFYRLSSDSITMPPVDMFKSKEGYYSTLFHEITHSTGHPKRLDRISEDDALTGGFGSKPYAREELVAEMGAAFLCGEAGITPNIENSASYIGSWLSALANDHKLVVIAAQRAQKAADYVLGRVQETAKEKDNSRAIGGAA